jgi:hypothetical protein
MMAEQQKSDDAKEPLSSEQEKSDLTSGETKESSTELKSDGAPETEWIPGEHLPLIRLPHATVWPVTLALGLTGMAFGVVTHWILSVAGLFLFLLGAAGWIEDLRKDVLQ